MIYKALFYIKREITKMELYKLHLCKHKKWRFRISSCQVLQKQQHMRRSLRFPVTLFENTELSGKPTKFLHEIPPIAGPSVSRLTMAVRKESRKWSKLMREFCMDSPWSRAGVSPDHHALSPRLYTRQLVEEADGPRGTNERESFADINRASTGNRKRSPCVSQKNTETWPIFGAN